MGLFMSSVTRELRRRVRANQSPFSLRRVGRIMASSRLWSAAASPQALTNFGFARRHVLGRKYERRVHRAAVPGPRRGAPLRRQNRVVATDRHRPDKNGPEEASAVAAG
jgi:hypothetical protein